MPSKSKTTQGTAQNQTTRSSPSGNSEADTEEAYFRGLLQRQAAVKDRKRIRESSAAGSERQGSDQHAGGKGYFDKDMITLSQLHDAGLAVKTPQKTDFATRTSDVILQCAEHHRQHWSAVLYSQ
jgi:hypothetical protein